MLENLELRVLREAEESLIKKDFAIKSMIDNGEGVRPFKEGNRYGFKYKGIILVPAKYSSYISFGKSGMYKVSFNRHSGLIDKYGNELFGCDYSDFHKLSNGVIVAENTSGFYIHGMGRISDRQPHDFVSLKQLSPEVSVITRSSQELDVYVIDDKYILKNNDGLYTFLILMAVKQSRNHLISISFL